MPRGIFQHTNNHPHKSHMKKADVKDFVKFCFREHIAKQLEGLVYPHQKAIELYRNETGKEVSAQTAYKQLMINGELCEIKKRKEFVPPFRPKTPHRAKPFKAPRSKTPPLTNISADDSFQASIEPNLQNNDLKDNSAD